MAYKWIRTRQIDIDGTQYHFVWDMERAVYVERESREAYDLFLLARGAFDDRGLLARAPNIMHYESPTRVSTESGQPESREVDAPVTSTSQVDAGGEVLPVARLPLFADLTEPAQIGGLCVIMGKTGVSKSFLAYRFSRAHAKNTSLIFAGEPDWRSVGSARQAVRMVHDYLGQRDVNDGVRYVVIDSIKELAFGGSELASGGVNVGLARDLSNLSALAARAGVWVIATLNPIHDDVADGLAAQVAASVQCLLNVASLDVASETFKCARTYRKWHSATLESDPFYDRLTDTTSMHVRDVAPFLESLVSGNPDSETAQGQAHTQPRVRVRERRQVIVQQPTVAE